MKLGLRRTLAGLLLALATAAWAAEDEPKPTGPEQPVKPPATTTTPAAKPAPVELSGPVPAFMAKDVTMVPFRPVFEWLGMTIEWDAPTKTVRATRADGTPRSLSLVVGKPQALVDDQPVKLPAPPVSRAGTTFVPLRFVAETLHVAVVWDATNYRAALAVGDREARLAVLKPYRASGVQAALTGEWQHCTVELDSTSAAVAAEGFRYGTSHAIVVVKAYPALLGAQPDKAKDAEALDTLRQVVHVPDVLKAKEQGHGAWKTATVRTGTFTRYAITLPGAKQRSLLQNVALVSTDGGLYLLELQGVDKNELDQAVAFARALVLARPPASA